MSVKTVAKTAIPTRSAIRKEGSGSVLTTWSVSGSASLHFEVHHLAHHHDADRHPDAGTAEDQIADTGGEQRHDVVRARKIDEKGDDERQGADDDGGRLRFHRQRLHLCL